MSYEVYKVIHIVGLILMFSGFAFLAALQMAQASSVTTPRKVAFLSHGIGLTLLIVSGFGLAARLGYMQNIPNWVYIKIVIWLIAGGLMTLFKRKAKWALPLFGLVLVLGACAAFLATHKPF